MEMDLNGLKEIRPVDGWSSLETCRIKLLCENCAYTTDWEEITLGRRVGKHKWIPVKEIECERCTRKAQVFVNEFTGKKRENDVLVMRLQANGLQPRDNFIQFDTDFVAEDVEGNLSEEFELKVGANQGPFNPQFTNVVGFERTVNRVFISFRRI